MLHRICDQDMEYNLSILMGKCYLFSGKFDMSLVQTQCNMIASVKCLAVYIQEIIMEMSSVSKCDKSLLILAESLYQLKVGRNTAIFLLYN